MQTSTNTFLRTLNLDLVTSYNGIPFLRRWNESLVNPSQPNPSSARRNLKVDFGSRVLTALRLMLTRRALSNSSARRLHTQLLFIEQCRWGLVPQEMVTAMPLYVVRIQQRAVEAIMDLPVPQIQEEELMSSRIFTRSAFRCASWSRCLLCPFPKSRRSRNRLLRFRRSKLLMFLSLRSRNTFGKSQTSPLHKSVCSSEQAKGSSTCLFLRRSHVLQSIRVGSQELMSERIEEQMVGVPVPFCFAGDRRSRQVDFTGAPDRSPEPRFEAWRSFNLAIFYPTGAHPAARRGRDRE